MPLLLDKFPLNPLASGGSPLHLHLPDRSCSPLLPSPCPSSMQAAQLAEFLPALGHSTLLPAVPSPPHPLHLLPPPRVSGFLVSWSRKVVYLPAMRTERWERWGTFPLQKDPCFVTSLCLGTSFLGHFMGKKSLEPPNPSLLGTTHHISLRDQRLQLSHDLLRILLQKKALGLSLSGPASHTPVSQPPHPPPTPRAPRPTSGPGEAQPLISSIGLRV